MNYWLIKSEPNTYSWDDLVKLGRDHWDGVRNFKARNNIKQMKVGGIAEVVKEYYQDPTTDDHRWYVMDVVPKEKLKRPVTLAEVKADERLSEMQLVKYSRLSVQAVKKEEFDIIIEMSER